ncbi:MAG: thioredoxin [Paramuribaculum sp.]|nr:thioredoxin [Paramuribaculum sp.]
MAVEFTDSNVKEAIASGHPVVIDFWATWCGPCMRLAPVIEELAEEYAERVVIGKYNIEEQTELSTDYRIMSIPTILFFKNGEQVRDLRMTGATKEELKARIEKLLAL